MRKSIISIFILIALCYCSCSSNQIDKKKLIGKWELVKVEGQNEYQNEHDQNDRPRECKQYLVITKDSITSLQQPCYFVDKGSYAIDKGNLTINFGTWQQTSLVSLTDKELKLKRLEGNSLNTYVYGKVESIDDVNDYREPYQAIWNDPSCFNGTDWEYTGKTIIVSDHLDKDSAFIPPKTIHIGDSGQIWMKCILLFQQDNRYIGLYAYKYNGIEMQFIPCEQGTSYQWLSDTAYTYRRVHSDLLDPS